MTQMQSRRQTVRHRIFIVSVLAALLVLGLPIMSSILGMSYLFWGIVPAILAVGVAAVSVRSIARGFSATQVLLGTPTLLLSAVSLSVLERMFFDRAWPTYVPYLAIALAIPIAAIQSYLARPGESR